MTGSMPARAATTHASPALTPQRILAATEDVLRRYGPAKATVSDIARELEVSPGSIYRHFPSKVALLEAVTRDWLDRTHAGLSDIAHSDRPAPQRLAQWVTALFDAKRAHAAKEPGLFDTYTELVEEFGAAAVDHVTDLTAQIEHIVTSGLERDEFDVPDPARAAAAIFACTTRFHHPLLARSWQQDAIDAELVDVIGLIIAGLSQAT